jgi:hypothetical protein
MAPIQEVAVFKMFGLFDRKKRFLEPHLEEWQVETWLYLLYHLGGTDKVVARQPLVAGQGLVPSKPLESHDEVLALAKELQAYMGLEDLHFELVEEIALGGRVSTFVVVPTTKPLGTFRIEDGQAIITYSERLLSTPSHLIAVLGHELCHYAMQTIWEAPPGAEEEPMIEELATDLACCYFGLGIVIANSAFEFAQHTSFESQGWQSSFSGYLSEEGRIFSLAIHLALRGETQAPALKPHLQKQLTRALERLQAEPSILQSLKSVVSRV